MPLLWFMVLLASLVVEMILQTPKYMQMSTDVPNKKLHLHLVQAVMTPLM